MYFYLVNNCYYLKNRLLLASTFYQKRKKRLSLLMIFLKEVLLLLLSSSSSSFFFSLNFIFSAGGTKYVVHNIIFKFATAKRTGRGDLFEDDADAAKVLPSFPPFLLPHSPTLSPPHMYIYIGDSS